VNIIILRLFDLSPVRLDLGYLDTRLWRSFYFLTSHNWSIKLKTLKKILAVLCFREHPPERLGYGTRGLKNLQKHKWFDGFNWIGLQYRTMTAPVIPIVSLTWGREKTRSQPGRWPHDEPKKVPSYSCQYFANCCSG